MARSPEERARDEQKVELALLGQLLPAHSERRHTKVVGVTHANADGSSRQLAIEKMRQFDVVELVRNPQDTWDTNAIKVMALLSEPGRRKKGEAHATAPEIKRVQIGHLDGELARELAPALDRGERWWAIATRVGGPRTQGVSLMLCRLA
jgi:hypothetical protein